MTYQTQRCSFDEVQQKLGVGLICLFKPVVRKQPELAVAFSVSDWVTAVTLLTLFDRRLSLSCFRAPSLFFHSIFSRLPLVFKRDGLIFPEIQFLSVWLMLFLCPSVPFIHFTFALVLSPFSQICYFKTRYWILHEFIEKSNQIFKCSH